MTSRPVARAKVSWSERLPTRQGLLFALKTRYSTRFHMALIVLASMGTALLVTKGLLAAGLGTMFWRYLVALLAAYTAFFIGVWVWVHLSAYGRHLRARRDTGSHYLDASPDIPLPDVGIALPRGSSAGDGFGGGGGTFDGGGASASWDAEPLSAGSPLDALGEGAGAGAEALGDEGGLLLVIAIGLMVLALVTLFGAVGLVVWQAPVILAEVIFEVLLASSLIKGVRGVESRDWSRALLRRTWKPFAFVCAMALAFAIFAGIAAPQARTAAEVVRTLSGK